MVLAHLLLVHNPGVGNEVTSVTVLPFRDHCFLETRNKAACKFSRIAGSFQGPSNTSERCQNWKQGGNAEDSLLEKRQNLIFLLFSPDLGAPTSGPGLHGGLAASLAKDSGKADKAALVNFCEGAWKCKNAAENSSQAMKDAGAGPTAMSKLCQGSR